MRRFGEPITDPVEWEEVNSRHNAYWSTLMNDMRKAGKRRMLQLVREYLNNEGDFAKWKINNHLE